MPDTTRCAPTLLCLLSLVCFLGCDSASPADSGSRDVGADGAVDAPADADVEIDADVEVDADADTLPDADVSRVPGTLEIDPSFDAGDLPAAAQTWYTRYWYAINNDNGFYEWRTLAGVASTYNYGRVLNSHITTLMRLLRATGDPDLLDEIDNLAQSMRGALDDDSDDVGPDGYLNWVYNGPDDGSTYDNDELYSPMDMILTHSLVAGIAYTYYMNRNVSATWQSRHEFWYDYLKNHFEAVWRSRSTYPLEGGGIAYPDFPFLAKYLNHAYAQFIRYHYYMYQINGLTPYLSEANRMAVNLNAELDEFSTALGDATIWRHGNATENPSTSSTFYQHCYYAYQVAHAMQDLYDEGFHPAVFSESMLQQVAIGHSHYVLDNGTTDYSFYIDGHGTNRRSFVNYERVSWAELLQFDASDTLETKIGNIYSSLESNASQPDESAIPAAMTLFEIADGE